MHFLQIWITPEDTGGEPVYQQRHFSVADKRGRLRLLISPNGRDDSLRIQQHTNVYPSLLHDKESASLTLDKNRLPNVNVARGSIDLNGGQLEAGDGLRLRNPETLQLSAGTDAEVLVFGLRPLELPQTP